MSVNNNVGGFNGGDALGSQYANNGFSQGGSFGVGNGQDTAGSKLQSDAHTLNDDIKGGADKKTIGQDAKQLLGDYKDAQKSGINPDKAGSLEDIQKLLEEILSKNKGGQQAGGGQQSGGGQGAGGAGKGGDQSFEDIIKAFIKALQESKGGDEAQGADADKNQQDGQDGQNGLSGPKQFAQDAKSFTDGGSFGGGSIDIK